MSLGDLVRSESSAWITSASREQVLATFDRAAAAGQSNWNGRTLRITHRRHRPGALVRLRAPGTPPGDRVLGPWLTVEPLERRADAGGAGLASVPAHTEIRCRIAPGWACWVRVVVIVLAPLAVMLMTRTAIVAVAGTDGSEVTTVFGGAFALSWVVVPLIAGPLLGRRAATNRRWAREILERAVARLGADPIPPAPSRDAARLVPVALAVACTLAIVVALGIIRETRRSGVGRASNPPATTTPTTVASSADDRVLFDQRIDLSLTPPSGGSAVATETMPLAAVPRTLRVRATVAMPADPVDLQAVVGCVDTGEPGGEPPFSIRALVQRRPFGVVRLVTSERASDPLELAVVSIGERTEIVLTCRAGVDGVRVDVAVDGLPAITATVPHVAGNAHWLAEVGAAGTANRPVRVERVRISEPG